MQPNGITYVKFNEYYVTGRHMLIDFLNASLSVAPHGSNVRTKVETHWNGNARQSNEIYFHHRLSCKICFLSHSRSRFDFYTFYFLLMLSRQRVWCFFFFSLIQHSCAIFEFQMFLQDTREIFIHFCVSTWSCYYRACANACIYYLWNSLMDNLNISCECACFEIITERKKIDLCVWCTQLNVFIMYTLNYSNESDNFILP